METRTRLLKAAKSVFEDNGFLAARISDITKRAGLSHGSFYNYFDSKQEIFREVASAMQQQFGAHSVLIEGMRFDSVADPILPEWFAELYRRFLEEYRREARIMGVIEQVSRYDETSGQRASRTGWFIGLGPRMRFVACSGRVLLTSASTRKRRARSHRLDQLIPH